MMSKLTLAVGLLAGLVLSGSAQNLLQNPSFETLDGKNPDLPDKWITNQRGSLGKHHSVDSSVAKDGKNSAKITNDNPALDEKAFISWMQYGLAEALNKDNPAGTEMVFAARVNTNGIPAVKFRIYVEMEANGKYLTTFCSPNQSFYAGWGSVAVKFNMPKETPDNVYVALQLLTPGTVYFDDVYLGKVSEAPAFATEIPLLLKDYYVRVSDFPPQQTYYLPQVPKTLSLAAKLPEGQAVKVSLSTIAGKLIKSYGEVKGSIEIPPLEAGSYLLQYDAGDIKDEDVFRIVKPSEKGVRFSADHRMTLDNKPFFPIMVLTPAMTEEALKIYGAMGFNSIAFNNLTANASAAKYLSEISAKNGMATVSWSTFGGRSGLSDAELYKKMDAEIQVARSLSNFIGWLDDESEWYEYPLKSVRRAYHKIFSDAPEFAVWQNHAPRLTDTENLRGSAVNVRRYTRLGDVIGCDIYPIPQSAGHSNLPNKTLSCVGEYTDLVMESGFGQKPVWMILQGMGWSEENKQPLDAENPRPDYRQLRFMTYNAITHGATGIAFYGPAGLKDIYSPFMAILSDVFKELTAITPFLLGGDQVKAEFSADPEIRVKIYRVQEDYLIIAVNEGKKSVSFKLVPPVADRKFYQLPAGQVFTLPDIALEANEVKILSTRPLVIPQTPVFKAETATPGDKSAGSLGKMSWTAQWAAHPKFFRTDNKTTFARQSFNLTEVPAKFEIRVTGDDSWKFAVNGQAVGDWGHVLTVQFDIAKYLKKGDNELTFEIYNIAGPSGLLYEGEADVSGQKLKLASGENTLFSEDGKSDWVAPYLAGTPPVAPWGELTLLVKAN